MPSTKGFLDNVKTTSYRMDSIQSVRQARKAPSNVKITVAQDGTNKTYDFEAENEATAGMYYYIYNVRLTHCVCRNHSTAYQSPYQVVSAETCKHFTSKIVSRA